METSNINFKYNINEYQIYRLDLIHKASEINVLRVHMMNTQCYLF